MSRFIMIAILSLVLGSVIPVYSDSSTLIADRGGHGGHGGHGGGHHGGHFGGHRGGHFGGHFGGHHGGWGRHDHRGWWGRGYYSNFYPNYGYYPYDDSFYGSSLYDYSYPYYSSYPSYYNYYYPYSYYNSYPSSSYYNENNYDPGLYLYFDY